MTKPPHPLLSRLRDLGARAPGELSVEDVESELARIGAAKLSKGKAGRAKQNLRDRIIYALTEAEDATGFGLPPLMPQPVGDVGSMQQAALVEAGYATACSTIITGATLMVRGRSVCRGDVVIGQDG